MEALKLYQKAAQIAQVLADSMGMGLGAGAEAAAGHQALGAEAHALAKR